MGSRSFGVQAIGFGFSVATTWPDRQCRRIRNARALEEQFDSGNSRFALALGERLRFVRWPSAADRDTASVAT